MTDRGLRVAMALYSDLDHDSRVLREADSLARAGHDVTVFCLSYEGPPPESFRVVAHVPDRSSVVPDGSNPFHRSSRGSRLGRLVGRVGWMAGYIRNLRAWGHWAVRAAGPVDAWHAHDLPGLMAVGPFVDKTAALVYDSHEIFLETGTATRMPKVVRRLLGVYERRLVHRVTAMVTVNEAYAEVLSRRTKPARIVLVRNCPPRWTPSAGSAARLRAAAGVPASSSIILYHGALGPHRGIEQLVAALSEPQLADSHLVLLGFRGCRPARDQSGRPRPDGAGSSAPCCSSDGAARMGRRSRRGRDAPPAIELEPLVLHAKQAVGELGGRRPGRRQRLSGHAPDRPRRSARRPGRGLQSVRPGVGRWRDRVDHWPAGLRPRSPSLALPHGCPRALELGDGVGSPH